MTPLKSRRVYIDINEADDIVIRLMTRKTYMNNKDYQNFFSGLLYNAARQAQK